RNIVNLVHILKSFEMGSSFKVNILKSRILGVEVSEADIKAVASSIGCAHGTFHFSYLGLPVGKKIRLKRVEMRSLIALEINFQAGKPRIYRQLEASEDDDGVLDKLSLELK
nr:RNA-directed DNA polymerase, eukaryota, reverse transcriptase zinc-binding domain protein [Tanacetum cinerariifolium]